MGCGPIERSGNPVNKKSKRILLVLAAFALLIVPVVAFAAAGFGDVDSDNVFVADIQWMKDNDITRGCNPPANTNFCPGNVVTRQQMSAFMHRLAVNKVVDAATAVNADNADTLDGEHASAFLGANAKAANSDNLDGKDSTEFLTKSVYDTNDDSVVDSAEVKIRYSDQSGAVDIADSTADRVVCVASAMTFAGTTTVVASGSLSLQPIGTSANPIYGYVFYSANGGTTWSFLNGMGSQASPSAGTGAAAVPINAVQTLPAGTYTFGIKPFGSNHLAAGNDYNALCELTITAYVGLGASIDVGLDTADLSGTDK